MIQKIQVLYHHPNVPHISKKPTINNDNNRLPSDGTNYVLVSPKKWFLRKC